MRITDEFISDVDTACDRSTLLHWLAAEEHYLAELALLGSGLADGATVDALIQSHLWAADLAGMIATAEHAAGQGQGYRLGGYGLEADNWTVYLLGHFAAARSLTGRAAVLDSLATHLHQRGYSERVVRLAEAIAAAFRASL
ncbi:hypothetical protein ACWEOG_19370 [Amycolatopsis japonica]